MAHERAGTHPTRDCRLAIKRSWAGRPLAKGQARVRAGGHVGPLAKNLRWTRQPSAPQAGEAAGERFAASRARCRSRRDVRPDGPGQARCFGPDLLDSLTHAHALGVRRAENFAASTRTKPGSWATHRGWNTGRRSFTWDRGHAGGRSVRALPRRRAGGCRARHPARARADLRAPPALSAGWVPKRCHSIASDGQPRFWQARLLRCCPTLPFAAIHACSSKAWSLACS